MDYDSFNTSNLINQDNTHINPSFEVGTTGLYQFGGYILEEFLPVLRFPNATKIYKEMAYNDAMIHSILYAIEMLIRRVEWRVTPFSDKEMDRRNAEFVEECMNDTDKSFGDIIAEIVSFLTYGFSVHEVVYKRRFGPLENDPRFNSRFNDGRWGWRKISIRSQDTLLRWSYGPKNLLEGVWQYPPNYGGARLIPRWKFLLFRVNSKKDNPESVSILRHAYRSWYFKKRIEEIEAIGIERDLAGLPVARMPTSYMTPGAPVEMESVFKQMKQAVSMIRQNEKAGIIVPSDTDANGNKLFDIELLGSPGQKQFNTNEVINRYNSQIAQSVLADFILLGTQGGSGSYALSESKIDLFSAALETWIDSIQDEFNRNAIPRLFKINGMSVERLPQLAHTKMDVQDITKISTFINQLASVGAINVDGELEKWLRSIIKAPSINDETF